jgi:hydrogen peroxide-dependent heme synthase
MTREPLVPTTGWNVVHLFCAATPAADAGAISAAVKSLEGDQHQVVPVAVLGHKADLCLLALGPDLWRLRRFQTEVAAAGLDVVDSYVSLTEVSEYAAGFTRSYRQRESRRSASTRCPSGGVPSTTGTSCRTTRASS